jgi:hypothetical protein
MLRRRMAYALLIVGSCGLATCGSPAVRSDRMAPAPAGETEFAAISPLRGSISLKDVGGGEPTTEDSTVGDDQLRQAVLTALEQYGLLQTDDAKARFRLNVMLVRLSHPGADLNLTVNSQLRYTLTRVDTGAVLFNDIVRGSYTAKIGDEFVAFLRLRLAKEGSVRANIAAFLDRLRTLSISSPPKQSAALAQ